MTSHDIQDKVLLFKVFANSVRLGVIEALDTGQMSVNELCRAVGESQTRISHELRCLTVCGIVNFNRQGKSVIYSLNKTTVLPILRAVEKHVGKFGERMKGCEMISEAKRVTIHALTA